MENIISNLSVDCAIFGFHNNTLNVLLTERTLNDPVTGELLFSDFTLQGHHLQVGEDIYDAAVRVLKDKTGLTNIFLKQFYTFGDINRLKSVRDQLWLNVNYPNISDHVVTICYYSLVDSSITSPDKEHPDTKWVPINELPELAFDHERILFLALHYLREEIRREPIAFELLPEKFTLTQLQRLYEVILGTTLDKRNFRKKLTQARYIIPLDEKKKGTAHKPANIFIFSRDVYEKTKKEKLDIQF